VSHPGAKIVDVDNLPALRFADVARRLGAAAHAAGLEVPAFRCPPRVPGAARTIRRYPGGTVVSVCLRNRRFEDAVADMVDGVLVANRVEGAGAPRIRAQLHAALAAPAAPEPATTPACESEARAA
jgi:hypothetical protein